MTAFQTEWELNNLFCLFFLFPQKKSFHWLKNIFTFTIRVDEIKIDNTEKVLISLSPFLLSTSCFSINKAVPLAKWSLSAFSLWKLWQSSFCILCCRLSCTFVDYSMLHFQFGSNTFEQISFFLGLSLVKQNLGLLMLVNFFFKHCDDLHFAFCVVILHAFSLFVLSFIFSYDLISLYSNFFPRFCINKTEPCLKGACQIFFLKSMMIVILHFVLRFMHFHRLFFASF